MSRRRAARAREYACGRRQHKPRLRPLGGPTLRRAQAPTPLHSRQMRRCAPARKRQPWARCWGQPRPEAARSSYRESSKSVFRDGRPKVRHWYCLAAEQKRNEMLRHWNCVGAVCVRTLWAFHWRCSSTIVVWPWCVFGTLLVSHWYRRDTAFVLDMYFSGAVLAPDSYFLSIALALEPSCRGAASRRHSYGASTALTYRWCCTAPVLHW